MTGIGFDIVVEATGSAKILEDAIHYVRRGGKLVVYGVYPNSARVSWPPSKICRCSDIESPTRKELTGRRQSETRSPSSAPSLKCTCSRPPSIIWTRARSRSRESSTRRSNWNNGGNVSRLCEISRPLKLPSPFDSLYLSLSLSLSLSLYMYISRVISPLILFLVRKKKEVQGLLELGTWKSMK